MSQNNTNRDIRRFETDADGNTTRVLLNTDEPLGLLDGDYQEKLVELENRLNAITGGAYSNTVQIGHGGTGAESAQIAFDNLISSLNSSLAAMTPSFIVKRNEDGAGAAISVDDAVQALGALKASNNLSDVANARAALVNLIKDLNDVELPPGVPATVIIDPLKILISNYGTGVTPYKMSMKYIVDNYLSEYFTKKFNDLSDLDSISNAVSNLIDGLSASGIPVINRNVELMAKQPHFPSGTGKITLEDIFDKYLLSAFNTEYGMTKDAQTNLYGFTGNAATADVATTARGLSMSGGSVNMALKSVTKQIASGQNTYVFSSSDSGSFSVNDTIIGIRGFVTGGNGSVSIKNDYTIENTKTGKTVTVDANVSTDGVAEVYLLCYYLHNLND